MDGVRELLLHAPREGLFAVLCSPSNDAKWLRQTPMMLAAASGTYAVYTALLTAIERAQDANASVGWHLVHCCALGLDLDADIDETGLVVSFQFREAVR